MEVEIVQVLELHLHESRSRISGNKLCIKLLFSIDLSLIVTDWINIISRFNDFKRSKQDMKKKICVSL